MNNEDRSKEKVDVKGQDGNQDDYQFLDQKIKKRPINKKAWLTRILWIVIGGVAVGLIASLVFSLMHPELREDNSSSVSETKITIPEDEEPEETPEPTLSETPVPTETPAPEPEVTEVPGEGGGTEEDPQTDDGGGEDGTEEGAPEDGSQEDAAEDGTEEGGTSEEGAGEDGTVEGGAPDGTDLPVPVPGNTMTLAAYRDVYRQMLEVARNTETSLVQVIGITSEMDYFDQGYENQRRISGTVVAVSGTDVYILTEYRVVEQVERIQVLFDNSIMADANFQASDSETGLAILKVPLANIPEGARGEIVPARLGNSFLISRGEPVMALGSPLGYSDSIAFGIVTSVSGKLSVTDGEYDILSTDIDSAGDSSGVLVNLDGQIIGIITRMESPDGAGITALSISQVKELIQDLSNNEERNYIGILGTDVTQEITDRTGIPQGVMVTEVVLDSPASLAGIKEADVIVRVGDDPIENMRDLHRRVHALNKGSEVEITAMRKGAEGYAEVAFTILAGTK